MVSPKANELEIGVFGRGFGECIVVGLGNNKFAIIDSFMNPDTGRSVALDYLECMGFDPKEAINYIVISHWHSDHIKMISDVIDIANQAKIIISPVMSDSDFLQYMLEGIEQELDCTAEVKKLLDSLKHCGDRLIWANNMKIVCMSDNVQVIALSPQDKEWTENLKIFFSDSEIKTRREYANNNLLSIVLLVKFDDNNGVLLGSDLENVPNVDLGWSGVLKNYYFKNVKSSVFKIPHHGSITGHNKDVWEKLLIQKPISILTVYNKGWKLPQDSDIDRISALSKSTYVVGAKTKEEKRIAQKVHKTCPNVEIEVIPPSFGFVRYRKRLDDSKADPTIECFGQVMKKEPLM